MISLSLPELEKVNMEFFTSKPDSIKRLRYGSNELLKCYSYDELCPGVNSLLSCDYDFEKELSQDNLSRFPCL